MSGRRGRGTPSRTRQKRSIKSRVLIVCEGQKTERLYFDRLKREDRVAKRFDVTVKKGKGGSREQIAKYAIQRKNDPGGDYDEVWCVMDVEGSSHRDSLDKALALLRVNDITPCLSNPAFEVWLLAHFEKTGSPFNDCSGIIIRLTKHWRDRFGTDYQKNDSDIFRKLRPMLDTALSRAKWVREQHHQQTDSTCDCNSCTDVYSLVGHLLGCGDELPATHPC